MGRNPSFYFGSIIFFLGVLLMAVGVSRAIAQNLDVLMIVEVVSGVILIFVGSRAIGRSSR